MATPVIDPRIPTEPEGSQTTRPAIDLAAAVAAPVPVPMPTAPIPALWDDDDGLPALGDNEDDDGDGQVGGVVRLAEYRPGADAPRTPQQQPRGGGPTLYAPPPAEEERLDDRYRIVQVQRQQESDLDWLMRSTGGWPQPQQQQPATTPAASVAPAAQTQPTPQAAPQTDAQSFAASSRWWGEQSERVWSFLQGLLETRRQMLNTMATSPLAARGGGSGNAVQDFLENKIQSNIADAQRRQTEADEIAAGTRAAPQTGLVQEMGRDAARGGVALAANTIQAAAYGWEYARQGRMSEAAEANIYRIGAVMDEWAKQTFPDDPARQHEFTGMLAEGFGSMVTFLGPGLATQLLFRGGPRVMAWIMGGTSGTIGAFGTAGSMENTALKAMREHRTVGGEPVTEETLRSIFPWALGIGATEAAPIMRFLNRSGGTTLTRILSQMGEEGGQEWFQQVGENIVARANYDDLRKWDDNAWSGLAVGTILGAGMQGGAELRGTGAPGAIGACCAGVASDRGARG